MQTKSAQSPVKAKAPGKRARSKMERQDRITIAARRHFAENGYDATTLREVANDAGLGLGTLFNYISDKRDLIYLIFNDEMDSLTDKSLAAPRPWQSFGEKVLSITEFYYRLFGGDPVLSRILLSEILLHTPGLHFEKYLSIRGRLIRGMEEIVTAAQQTGEIQSVETPEIIARHIFFTLSAHLRWWLASSSQPDWRTGLKEFERILSLQITGLVESSRNGKSAPLKKTGTSSKRLPATKAVKAK